MSQDAEKLERDSSVELALHNLRQRQEEANRFSWGKGIVVGILGKLAGTAAVGELRKYFKNSLYTDIMRDTAVQKALSKATTRGETQAVIDTAMKNAAAGLKGLKGHVMRNPLLWAIGGGVAGGLGALGIEYSFHVDNKKENEKNLRDIQTAENHWATRIENERQNAAGREKERRYP